MPFSVSGYFIAPNEMNFNALHSNYTNCRALSISTIRKCLVFLLESHFVGVARQPYAKYIGRNSPFYIELKGMVSHTFCSLSQF